jgi:hypothetical protein
MQMNRRDFLRTSLISVFGTAVSCSVPSAVSHPPDYPYEYSDALAGDRIVRQAILDKKHRDQGGRLYHVGSLKYVETLGEILIQEILRKGEAPDDVRDMLSKYGEFMIKETFSLIPYERSDIGGFEKPPVYIFSGPFENFMEGEFDIFLCKQDSRCKDIYRGLALNGELFDAEEIHRSILDELMGLRSSYDSLERIVEIKKEHGGSLPKDIRLGFILYLGNMYEDNYARLYEKIDRSTSYEKYVIEKHVKNYTKWIPADSRYDRMELVA